MIQIYKLNLKWKGTKSNRRFPDASYELYLNLRIVSASRAEHKTTLTKPAFPASSSFKPSGKPIAALCHAGAEALRKAQGDRLFISGIKNLLLHVQNTLMQIFEARQECELGDYEHKIAAVFVSNRLSLQELRTEHDMDPEFLNSIFGTQILVTSLEQRMDFRTLAAELLKEISPEQILSKPALDLLETRECCINIRQLKKCCKC